MKREIYEGNYTLIPSLESAVLVDYYELPGMTAEGMKITITHLSGVTVKQECYEDSMRTVAVHPPPEDLRASMSYTGKMRITLYAQDDYALGNMERVILEEIGKKIEY